MHLSASQGNEQPTQRKAEPDNCVTSAAHKVHKSSQPAVCESKSPLPPGSESEKKKSSSQQQQSWQTAIGAPSEPYGGVATRSLTRAQAASAQAPGDQHQPTVSHLDADHLHGICLEEEIDDPLWQSLTQGDTISVPARWTSPTPLPADRPTTPLAQSTTTPTLRRYRPTDGQLASQQQSPV